jgi:hypothetical protein
MREYQKRETMWDCRSKSAWRTAPSAYQSSAPLPEAETSPKIYCTRVISKEKRKNPKRFAEFAGTLVQWTLKICTVPEGIVDRHVREDEPVAKRLQNFAVGWLPVELSARK